MTTDPFTEAARAEAERRTRPPGISGQTLPSMEQFAEREGYKRGFTDAAEWARTHIAAQEPTGAEVMVAAWEIHRLRAQLVGEPPASHSFFDEDLARAALSAARNAGRAER